MVTPEQRRTLLRQEIARRLPGDVLVEIDDWDGYEPDPYEAEWKDPVYITAQAPGAEFSDAILDAGVGFISDQAEFAVRQLLTGN